MKVGAPVQIKRGNYVLADRYRTDPAHPFRLAQALVVGSYVSMETALAFPNNDPRRKLKIKLEIDVEPPAHSNDAYTFLDFPVDYEVRHQDMTSNFALKIHALLCREYLKGRDWFDFSWYVAQGASLNLPHLEAALRQFGPWSHNDDLNIDTAWLDAAMIDKIRSINWEEAREDVRRFLRPAEEESLIL